VKREKDKRKKQRKKQDVGKKRETEIGNQSTCEDNKNLKRIKT